MFAKKPSKPRCRFLELPLELRQHIYEYILPCTASAINHSQYAPERESDTPALQHVAEHFIRASKPSTSRPVVSRSLSQEGDGIIWHRGCVALFPVNRQIHDECVDVMYGRNVFVVDVRYDTIRFKFRWLLPSGLTPSREFSFLDHFSQRNLSHIKNYVITVEKVDSYTGMVKFNCGGSGLTPGLKAQVERLVDVMKLSSDMRFLHLKLKDGSQSRMSVRGQTYPIPPANNPSRPQAVLDPFMTLRGLSRVMVDGSVTREYARRMETLMTQSPFFDG